MAMTVLTRTTLLLALLLPVLSGAGPAVAQPIDESIPSAFQVFSCPEDYTGDDYLGDCSPVGAGAFFIMAMDTSPTEPMATTGTDASGEITFATLPGPTVFALQVPAETTVYYACFDGAGTYLRDGAENTVEVSLAEGDALSCRWYITPSGGVGAPSSGSPPTLVEEDPADASVGVQVFDCPEGYDGGEYADDCAPTQRPVGLTINDGYEFDDATVIADRAGDEGRAGFVDLLRGQYYLAVEDLTETSTIYWSCFDLEGGAERFDQDGYHNRIRFYLDSSAGYACRIYLTANGPETPEPGTAGTVTVNVLGCPESYDGPDWSTECTVPIDGPRVAITGYPSSGVDGPRGLEIYEGVAVFQDVSPGTYGPATDVRARQTNQPSACVIGSGPVDDALIQDASSNGTVTIAEGEGATCVVYIVPLSFRA